ncbi:MAG: pyruvate dehydrogenase (acetyl-transferring), homodimeric type [Planctomycetales bacterium]|nr:MAG: pyruvate dehydrogenase (acetyl-transferring), homodimeric type [Planctomycetales bacterium]
MDHDQGVNPIQDHDPQETQEWLDSLQWTLSTYGPERVDYLISRLEEQAALKGVGRTNALHTPYINSIPKEQEAAYPGDREMERRIKSIIRWNALAMVLKANRESDGIGGHLATYQSSATIFEVGFNHFFRAPNDRQTGDLVYMQGHASPGIYARAFLEGRLSADQLGNFRRELAAGGGLSSYPHPWLMPDFWQFPTVSMGLSPIMSIYQARFNRYIQHRGLRNTEDCRVWATVGDGETDEPETLGAITLAGREKLDNLTWIVNCNLQRLDGPVRGNGKIIQELEGLFHGAGWNVIKVIWGDEWDDLVRRDKTGLLVRRMGEVVDGQYQKYAAETGEYIRKDFFGKYPELLELVKDISDEKLVRMRRGGHDPEKVHAAFHAATHHKGQPTVILAKTIKGYGLGPAGQAKNVAHNLKKMKNEEVESFQKFFNIPLEKEQIVNLEFYRPAEDSPEIKYLKARREELGGYLPQRHDRCEPVQAPGLDVFDEFLKGTGDKEASTTMAWVRMLAVLLRNKEIGKLIVPIVPDEARTFGMEGLFRQAGIYASTGQLYTPVDSDTLLYYKEAKNGQILEEGINEAGAMSSFIAAGTAYTSLGVNTIPMYIYYSMFGFQRIGDLIWAAADMRCKGFLFGGTSGRTTLNGEGLQHEDGHSHLVASTVPSCVSYDPAFAFELAVIMQDGIRRMYQDREDVFYYVTVMNENYQQPEMPKGVEEGIRRGMYRFSPMKPKKGRPHLTLFGSGTILREVLKAQEMLATEFDITSDVWSITSYNELRRDGMETERWNRLHPDKAPKVPYITKQLEKYTGPVVAASDYMRALPDLVDRWIPGRLHSLGTDGFGRSESREALRGFFEVDAASVVVTALNALREEGELDVKAVRDALKKYGIDVERDPAWKL